MALKLTKGILISFEVEEVMKYNCACINGTCTTRHNSYLCFWILTGLQFNGLKLRLGFGSVALKGPQYGTKHNCYGIQAFAACSCSRKDCLGSLTLANHFWSPDIICAALKFHYQRAITRALKFHYQRAIVRVPEWPARAFKHSFTTKVHLTSL